MDWGFLFGGIVAYIAGNVIYISIRKKQEPGGVKGKAFEGLMALAFLLILGGAVFAITGGFELGGVYGNVTWVGLLVFALVQYGVYKAFMKPQDDQEKENQEKAQKEAKEKEEAERKKQADHYADIQRKRDEMESLSIQDALKKHGEDYDIRTVEQVKELYKKHDLSVYFISQDVVDAAHEDVQISEEQTTDYVYAEIYSLRHYDDLVSMVRQITKEDQIHNMGEDVFVDTLVSAVLLGIRSAPFDKETIRKLCHENAKWADQYNRYLLEIKFRLPIHDDSYGAYGIKPWQRWKYDNYVDDVEYETNFMEYSAASFAFDMKTAAEIIA